MLLPSGNPFKYHDEVLSLQPMFPPKRFGCVKIFQEFPVLGQQTRRTNSELALVARVVDNNSMYVCMYVCMYVWSHIQQSMDQPGKVANPVRGQLNRENEYSPVPVRA